MLADIDTLPHHRHDFFTSKKLTLTPTNKNIEFQPLETPVRIEECQPTSAKKSDTPKEAPERSSGRPKNARLSALAAKRNIGRTKKIAATSTPETTNDQSEKANIEEKSTPKTSIEVPHEEEKPTKKKFGLSSMERLAVSQNITHMASQVRQETMTSSDIIGLTQGLRCDEKPMIQRCLRKSSRGMGLLFPGKNKRSQRNYVDILHHHPLLQQRRVAETILNPNDLSERVKPFDFSTCPFEAVAMAVREEVEAIKKKRRHPKRLVADLSAPSKPQKKILNPDLDPLSAKRLLKNRLKDEPNRCCRVMICGEAGVGKSTLLSSFLRHCDPASIPEKNVTKVKWEAEKAGRPRDYLAWLVDELPAERRCGHSWDLSEVSTTLPSGRPCHLFDCPGNQLGRFSDLLAFAHVVVMVLDVTRAASADAEMSSQVRDFLKIIKEQSNGLDSQLIVVLNQIDRCNYSTVETNKAKSHFSKLVSDTYGDSYENSVLFIPACALTGDGLFSTGKESRKENGRVGFVRNLIDTLETVTTTSSISLEPSPVDLKPPVLRIRDVYENMGAGFTAVADVVQGLVAQGQSLVCFPSGAAVNVRTVQLPRGDRLVAVKCATAGELVHLVLWQVEMAAVTRGSIICHPLLSPNRYSDAAARDASCVQVRQRFEARIEVVNLHGRSLIIGRQAMFHAFASSLPAFVSQLLWVSVSSGPNAQNSDVKLKPMAVSRTGAVVGVELMLESSHVCIPALDIGLKFSLMINNSLMATGVISKVLEDEPALDALRIPDCCDAKRLLFHRSCNYEYMEVD